LPDVIQFKNGNQIRNLYDANGNKLETVNATTSFYVSEPITALEGTTLTLADLIKRSELLSVQFEYYIDNFFYLRYEDYATGDLSYKVDFNIERILNAEGYSKLNQSSLPYSYYCKDHLGNIREVWRSAYININRGRLNHIPAGVQQRTQYYPSGLPWAYQDGDNPDLQHRKYNGKEFVETHGYDTYDYGARGYYPAIGRFTTVDPLAEKYYSISPYAYCAGNPVNRIDPNGMDWYSYQEEYTDEDGKKQTRTAYKYVRGEMSKKELEEGGYTHLGKTYDNGKGTYFSFGGSEVKYDKEDVLSVLAVNRLKGADNSVIATINEFKSDEGFWIKYKSIISTGTDAANTIGEFMDLSKGFKGKVGIVGYIIGGLQLGQDILSYKNGSLKGEALNDAIINIVSLTGGPYGAALSLSYNTVAKPGAHAVVRLEYFLRSYIPELIIRRSNGMY
jgi:RHS repeat-associated protein